jgi:hypothetical protein
MNKKFFLFSCHKLFSHPEAIWVRTTHLYFRNNLFLFSSLLWKQGFKWKGEKTDPNFIPVVMSGDKLHKTLASQG